MSNRVEELERKASELQAAVNGLTEELVETKERLRQLEDAVEVDDPAVRAKPRSEPETETDAADDGADTETDSDADADAEPAAEEDEPEQRFVDADEHEKTLEDTVGPEGNNSGEEAKTEDDKEEETESEQDGSDIIVA
ncbi:chromosome segregation protein SMC [Salinigranum rubrum]|uniref:Chromosome segregation protein SMC n=1 Tax=Salinigranum rubrum TaxID=755307 RepID=A0A2I8VG88_9EURY|nr:chromosome segregation protein SMC [Salinigranum rubrum]AUV80945.1 chromosome segregation protein SMC [Salinigranum rubrum]